MLLSECAWEARLLADFVSRNSVKLFVAFDRDYLGAICGNGVIAALPEHVEAIVFQIPDEVTSLDRRHQPLQATVR